MPRATENIPKVVSVTKRNHFSNFVFLSIGAAVSVYYGEQLHYQHSQNLNRLRI